MPITSLKVADFRNLAAVELAPYAHGLNLICGKNGSGKTSLLEAIHYLGLGRSFRSHLSTPLIRQSADKFSLYAQVVSETEHLIPVGAERDQQGSSKLRVAGKDIASITELAALLPILTINSQSHQLLESGPAFRRRYLDWGLFYQTEGFLTCWRHYERALKQRNVLLRERRLNNEIHVWTNELIKHGVLLDNMRREYVAQLLPLILTIAARLTDLSEIEMEYQSGWDNRDELAVVFKRHEADEMRLGHTLFGPHRADLDIKIQGVSAKHFLSRGQQKLLICAMILAQGMLLSTHKEQGLIYLVDDLPSELDPVSRQKLILLLKEQKTQVFITAIESNLIYDPVNDKGAPIKVFHVEHGAYQTLT